MATTAHPPAELENALRDVLGNDLPTETNAYALAGSEPRLVATPHAEEVLAAALAIAGELGASVIPWGAGLHQGYGAQITTYDMALDTTGLSALVEYEPADLTVTVAAGMTLGQLQQTLDANRQFLPFDGPSHATLGGLLAVAHTGPSQHAYGPVRDWVLGCRLALANGDVVRAGGRVVKNVAGYDLTRMAVGSLGTLGVMTEVTLKVAPQPAKQETLLIACPTTEAALTLARQVDKKNLALRAITAVENQLACWLAGSATAVKRTRTEIDDLAGDSESKALQGEAADRWWTSLDLLDATADVTIRASVPPSKVQVVTAEMKSKAEDVGVSLRGVASPAVGVISARLKGGDATSYTRLINDARAGAVAVGGSLVVTDASRDVKALVDPWGDVPGLDLMRALKREFDPDNVLNPGRFVGGL
jgi:glycolate oxidase FAD binding subunit